VDSTWNPLRLDWDWDSDQSDQSLIGQVGECKVLPNCKPWDHMIKLIPDAKPVNCKVYPLAPNKQKELNQFILENLQTGCICPSKSPMASPVFFVKKKDSSLCITQDYCALNAMMVKNCYPLPLILDLINQLCSTKYFMKLDV